MDPFYLSLNQVNFEKQTLESQEDEIHSFSNLVSYDCDFAESDTRGIPVPSKKVHTYIDRSPYNHQLSASSMEDLQIEQSFNELGLNNHSAFVEDEEIKISSMREEHHHEHKSFDVSDSFKAFTETVEALALQESVIGNKNTVPASAEEIAKVIEATRFKLSRENQLSHISESKILNVNKDSEKDFPDSDHKYLDGTKQGSVSQMDAVQMTSSNQSNLVNDPNEQSQKQFQGRQLIRVPPEVISTTTQKSKSWLWGSGEAKSPSRLLQTPQNGKVESKVPANNSKSLSPNHSTHTISRLQNPVEPSSSAIEQHYPSTLVPECVEEQSHSTDVSSINIVNRETYNVQSSEHLISVDGLSNTHEDLSLNFNENDMVSANKNKLVEAATASPVNNLSVNNNKNFSKVQFSLDNGDASSQTDIRVSFPSRQFSTDSVNSVSRNDTLVDLLMREKAKLEGHVEVLEMENRHMLKEHTELQTKVASLSQELWSRDTSNQGLTGDRDALTADLETLRSNRARLEAVILDAHKLLEEKDEELLTLNHDVELAKDASEKLSGKILECRQEVQSRDATIHDLKSKITELYVEFQTTNQNRILAENEVGSLNGELKAMIAAKEWYKDQLAASQKEKSELQSEITRVKSEMIKQGTSIERLKAENVRTKRNLMEVEQRLLSEKQNLARHLETIEADMMEREASFAEIHREREILLHSNSQRQEDESLTTVQEDLNEKVNELRKSQAEVASLQHEKSELSKRITFLQESVLERDKLVENTDGRIVEMESNLKQLELDVAKRDEDVARLEHERSILQMDLSSAKKEKQVFDDSLRQLKENLKVVETNFHLMKQELLTKQEELTRTQSDLTRLKNEKKDSNARELGIPNQSPRDHLEEIPHEMEFSMQSNIIRSLTKYTNSETQTETNITDDSKAERNAALIQQMELERVDMETKLSTAMDDLDKIKEDRQNILILNSSYERELILAKERLVEYELASQNIHSGREAASVERSELVENQVEVDNSAFVQLEIENAGLKSKFAEMEKESFREKTKEKSKAVKLGKQLETVLKEREEEREEYERQLLEMSSRVKMLEEVKEKMEVKLETKHQQVQFNEASRTSVEFNEVSRTSVEFNEVSKTSVEFNEVSRMPVLQSNFQVDLAELNEIKESKERIELELKQVREANDDAVEHYKKMIHDLQLELDATRSEMEYQKCSIEEEKANLALELEKEKGRLAGFLNTQSALREHASTLEATLASRESSVVQLSSQTQDELDSREREIVNLRDQLKILEEGMAKERQGVKEARKQMMTEKGNNVKIRRELEQANANHKEVVVELEALRKELVKVTSKTDAVERDEAFWKMEMEKLTADTKIIKLERDRLARELDDFQAKEATLLDQLKSREWKLSEKDAEITAALERIQMMEDRQLVEMSAVTELLQSTTSETYTLREELVAVTRERSELKTRIVQLKQALTTILQQYTNASTTSGNLVLSEMTISKQELERLLQDATPPTVESKPLSFLQVTLSGLRGEINCLQTQVNEHTTAVQSSSLAWRELEAQVQDLREICKSSAASRAESDRLQQDTDALVNSSPVAKIHMALQLPTSGPLVLPGNMVPVVDTLQTVTNLTTDPNLTS